MGRVFKYKWMLAVSLVVIAGLLFVARIGGKEKASVSDIHPLATQVSDRDERTEPTTATAHFDPEDDLADGDSQDCLTEAQLEGHPLLANEAYRFDAVSDSGPSIASYRGLTEPELQDLSAQGDAAAMIVLGTMSVMQAREWPVESAVPYLMSEDPALMTYGYSRPLSEEFLGHMARAREWYYEAALNGRVMVLHRVGDSLALEKGGPVQLGWITAEDYDELSDYERSALLPQNVYSAMAFEVAPGLRSGPLGEVVYDILPRTDRQRVIVQQLAEEFRQDLKARGLPPVVVSESTAPPIEILWSLLCESEKERLKGDRPRVR